MRCSEAKRRLTEHWLTTPTEAQDQELLQHLQVCPACARHAAAIRSLRQDFAAARQDYAEGGLPFPFLKTRVEAQVASSASSMNKKEKSLMSTLMNNFKKRPKLTATIGVVALLTAFLALIPFTFERTVGYEVAVAGVDRDLALDSNKVSALLTKLGMQDAEVDVANCEATCNLIIKKLKSQEDADLVAAAFSAGDSVSIQCEVIKLSGEESGSLLNHVKKTITLGAKGGADSGELHEILVERLGDACYGNAFVWMQCLSDSMAQYSLTADGDSVISRKLAWSVAGSDSQGVVIKKSLIMGKASGSDSTALCVVIQGAGDGSLEDICANLELENGEINEEVLQKLKDMGCDVTIETSENGSAKKIEIKCENVPGQDGGEGGGDSSAKESADENLPAGFALEQNYPNPFNPTTSISFSLPSAQHVKLEIYNVQGQKVRTLVDEMRSAGEHSIEWDATSDAGDKVASGVYFYRLTAGDYVISKKMTLLK
jgi:hypothetical protein